jgi:glutamate carboxypeptidase
MKRLALLAIALGSAVASAALTPAEEAIVTAVKVRSPAAIDLLERAVRINSGTLNAAGVREVGRLFDAELRALGFETRWVEMPKEMHRAGHLVATRQGSRGKRVLLLGHIDTVFDKESVVPIWERSGNIVHGQGVNDMKGGDVVMIEALRALRDAGALDGATITVVLTGDEERVGNPVSVSREALVGAAKRSDVALSFEAGFNLRSGIQATTARRGAAGWTLEVEGKPGHSRNVGSAEAGNGAIYEAARIVNAFREVMGDGVTANPGIAVGGSAAEYDETTASGTATGKPNIIAARMRVIGDLRYPDASQRERSEQRMREIVSQSLPGTRASIRFREAYPPMPETEGNVRLLTAYSQGSVDAGLGPIVGRAASDGGAGDIQYAAPYADCLDGLGTAGRGSHSDEEQMELASIERAAVRAALIIYRLTR